MSDVEKLLARVAALRALSARASTQSEAVAAAAAAAGIIARHNLDEAMVNATGESASCDAITEGTPLWEGRRRVLWVTRLVAHLAPHYGCFAWEGRTRLDGGTAIRLRVAGRASDVIVCRYMVAWAGSEITRLSNGERGRLRVAFCHGAVSGYAAALNRSKELETAAHVAIHGTSASMVVASRAENAREWADVTFGKRVAGVAARVSSTTREAFARGRDAGGKIRQPEAALSAGVRALPERSMR